MNLFARILSHGFALALVALLAIGLIYRGELFPGLQLPEYLSFGSSGSDSEPASESTQQQVAEAGDGTASSTGDEPYPSTVPDDSTGMAGAPEVEPAVTGAAPEPEQASAAATDMAAAQPAGAEADAPVSSADTGVMQDEVPLPYAGEGDSEPVMAAEPATDLPLTDRGSDITTQTPAEAQVPADTDTTDAGTSGTSDTALAEPVSAQPAKVPEETSSYRLLAAAREAYWLRDYEQAEQSYRAMIALDPDNPDGYGELGNMYFSQGDWEKASTAYYEAGTRLVDEGLLEHARQLVDVIRGLNGSQAGELEAKIRAATPPALD